MDTIKAVVQKIVPKGRHGPFSVATSDQVERSVTFSLEPTVWEEKEWPEEGMMVFLGKLRKKRAGWRAKQGRFWKPSDEQLQQTERSKEVSTATATQNTFKPFLVEGGRNSKNIFRVLEMTEGVTREQIERLLENLPIGFQLRKDDSDSFDTINEPLEVGVNGGIVYIYPPRHRAIVCTTFDSWKSADVVSKIRVDNVMDTVSPGDGQLRTCVHFDPKIFGIEGWPGTEEKELELDIHVYPKTKTAEPKLKALSFQKREVRKLLELIAGGERQLTVEQLGKWRELIMYAVMRMRANYENPDVPEDYSVRVYYKSHWQEIAAARNDEELIRALDSLAGAIQWE